MICKHPECTGWHTRVTGPRRQRVKIPLSAICPVYLEKIRAGNSSRKRRQRGREAGKEMTQIEPVNFDNEVQLVPGRCIVWMPRLGHCYNPSNGLACVEHKWDFDAEVKARVLRTRLLDEDIAYLATIPTCERQRARKRLTNRRMREDPVYREQENARRRSPKSESTSNPGKVEA
jgi:hypothetical protein